MKKFLVISLLILLVLFCGFAGYGYYVTNTMGDMIEQGNLCVYYKDPVTKKEAQDFLEKIKKAMRLPEAHRPIAVQLTKSYNKFAVHFIVREGIDINDQTEIIHFKLLGNILSKEIFNNAEIELHICSKDDFSKTDKLFFCGGNQ